MIEFLYIDEDRIDNYYEQIGDPVIYDKLLEKEGGVGLTELSGKLKQVFNGREPTRFEKVQTVAQWLMETKMVETDRSRARSFADNGPGLPVYFAEKVIARRGVITSNESTVCMWVSAMPLVRDQGGREEITRRNLYLLEDFPRVSEPKRQATFSSFSTLEFMLGELGHNNATDITIRLKELDKKYETSFATDPVRALEKIGAQFASPRTIDVIYRRRGFFTDINTSGKWADSQFCYPLVIAEAGSLKI